MQLLTVIFGFLSFSLYIAELKQYEKAVCVNKHKVNKLPLLFQEKKTLKNVIFMWFLSISF